MPPRARSTLDKAAGSERRGAGGLRRGGSKRDPYPPLLSKRAGTTWEVTTSRSRPSARIASATASYSRNSYCSEEGGEFSGVVTVLVGPLVHRLLW